MEQKVDLKRSPLSAQVLPAATAIEYQQDAVVSKTLVNKPGGTVTLFAFAQGQGLSEHTAPFDALVYILDGEAQITIAGKPYELVKDEMIIMPAHEPHALQAEKPFIMMLVMIKA